MRLRLVSIAIATSAAVLARPLPAQTPPAGAAALERVTPPASPVSAAAGTPRATPPVHVRTPTASATPTAAQAAAAQRLFKSLKLEESLPSTIAGLVDSEVSHNPGLAPYRDVMLAFLRKYMTWEAMLPELTKLYTDTYTEGELKTLAVFYASPVGQKALTKTPELMSKTAGIGARVSQAHMEELTAALTARREELKAQAAARTPGAGSTPPAAGAIPSDTPAATPAGRATPAPKTTAAKTPAPKTTAERSP